MVSTDGQTDRQEGGEVDGQMDSGGTDMSREMGGGGGREWMDRGTDGRVDGRWADGWADSE